MDYCEFYRNIEKDPTAIVPKMTVGQWFEAREHLFNCESCYLSSERVLAKAPQPKIKDMYGEN